MVSFHCTLRKGLTFDVLRYRVYELTKGLDEDEDSTPPSSPPVAATIPRRSKFDDEEDDSDVSSVPPAKQRDDVHLNISPDC